MKLIKKLLGFILATVGVISLIAFGVVLIAYVFY